MPRIAVIALLMISLAACSDDKEEAVPADWCERTTAAFRAVDTGYAPPIGLDASQSWQESAPEDIRASTEAAARFLQEIRSTPFPASFTDARKEIEAYARERCPADNANPS